ncbi:MAG: tRNA uridine-5-carboxymethylaminomethyl(34) synthesis enzyme MnmG [Prevotellaceae bacterium]|jgi:tRNA uridine 5-carboxymethylaminomethyl modification enzyme|nr:tRNA uridine-5-carboxymethylaminomethyl(34) synthesis enzyme MnmG [Prevotellaceae bacterium]
MENNYDIIVVGAGHAGCEAAAAAANMGSKVLLVTMDMGKIAQMSCNPAMGGIAKGQIIREVDALGGYSGIVTDASTMQFRMLNRSKGPAMWSPRAQCDKAIFSSIWRNLLENTPNVHFWQDSVNALLIENKKVIGILTVLGAIFKAKVVILTNGTFLNGIIHIGKTQIPGGRMGDGASYGLSEQLKSLGFEVGRMKTGTPARIDGRTVDFSKLIRQDGDNPPRCFSYLNDEDCFALWARNDTFHVERHCERSEASLQPRAERVGSNLVQIALSAFGLLAMTTPLNHLSLQDSLRESKQSCFIAHTSKKVHDILRKGFADSPMFSGTIKGIGPRYCPSVEDKLRVFADKDSHQLFLEPEGWNTNEYYIQGFSSSLPMDIQLRAMRKVEGLEKVEFFRPGYAIEYDYFPPVQLRHSLETKLIENLYFAGQINGTTGYEEAAAQGLMAGVNAHLKLNNQPEFILRRDQAYIGVLIDDLVTKGVDEPYRMFTSRAEYRILLRQDNADIRLTELSYNLGLTSEERYQLLLGKKEAIAALLKYVQETSIRPKDINPYLETLGSAPIMQSKKMAEILSRPEITLEGLIDYFGVVIASPQGEAISSLRLRPRGTKWKAGSNPISASSDCLVADVPRNDTYDEASSLIASEAKPSLRAKRSNLVPATILEAVEISIKYKGYIERERALADKLIRLEDVKIPRGFDFDKLNSVSIEGRQKLKRYQPETIGQASRITGISPADISVMLVYFGR